MSWPVYSHDRNIQPEFKYLPRLPKTFNKKRNECGWKNYNYSKKLINEKPNLREIWLQGSDKYKGAMTKESLTDIDNQLNELRNGWE